MIRTPRGAPSPLIRILSRSMDDDSVFTGHVDKYLDYDGLTRAGWFQPGPPAEYWHCDCEGHGGEVFWFELPDGTHELTVICDGCGWSRLTEDQLRTWAIVFPTLLRRIGEGMEFKYPFMEIIPGLVWKLGRRRNRDLYYVRRVQYSDRRTLQGHFQSLPTAVLVVPTQWCYENTSEFLPNLCVSVESISSFDEEYRIVLDPSSIYTSLSRRYCQ